MFALFFTIDQFLVGHILVGSGRVMLSTFRIQFARVTARRRGKIVVAGPIWPTIGQPLRAIGDFSISVIARWRFEA